MPDSIDILAKYRRAGQTPAKKAAQSSATAPKAKKPYMAYQLRKDSKRHLEVRMRYPLAAFSPINSLITDMVVEWRKGLMLTIYYGKTMEINISGKNLQALAEAVKDWKVDWLEEFDPKFHVAPEDKTAPLIERIEINKEPSEPLPPMNQRH